MNPAKQEVETAPAGRIAGFDYLRILAALAVVWIHGSDTNALAKSLRWYCSFAVPSFLLMSGFLSQLSAIRRPDSGFADLVRRRVHRLVPAYLGWSVLYILIRIAKRAVLSESAPNVNLFHLLFGGGAAYQLWFVPALIYLTILLGPVMILGGRATQHRRIALVLVLLGLLFHWQLGRWLGMLWPGKAPLFLGYLCQHAGWYVIGMGLALMHWDNDRHQLRSERGYWIVIPLAGLAFALAVGRRLDLPRFWVVVLTGSLFYLSLYASIPRARRLVERLSFCAFGIYLAHALFVEGLQIVVRKFSPAMLSRFWVTAGVVFGAFTASWLFCELLGRTRYTRWLVV